MRLDLVVIALAFSISGPEQCSRGNARFAPKSPTRPAVAPSASVASGPIRMEAIEPAATVPTFVMRGRPHGAGKLVFLHGMCGHGLGYAQSFQWTAAEKGLMIAPQGDVACGEGPWSKWSKDIDSLDARIVGTFLALDEERLVEDVAVIGYSQGATRAESLAREFPERYTRLVLIGAPDTPNPDGLSKLRGAVFMAG